MKRITGACFALVFVGCSGPGDGPVFPSFPPTTDRFSDVLVLALDGADWEQIDHRIEAGGLPHFARLRREGATGDLTSLEDYSRSPVIWNTISTGVEPARHGVEDFVTRQVDGNMMPISTGARRAPAFWHLFDEARIGVGVVGHWATWPAESLTCSSSFIISDRILAAQRTDLVHPEALGSEYRQEELFARFGFPTELRTAFAPFYDLERGELVDPRDWPFQKGLSAVRHHTSEDVIKVESALALGRHFDPEVMFSYVRVIDVVQHFFWPPDPSEGEIFPPSVDAPAIVDAAYRWADELLGRHLAAVRENANVIVLSDHGVRGALTTSLSGTPQTTERLGVADLVVPISEWYYQIALRIPVVGRDADGVVAPEDLEAVRAKVAGRILAIRTRDGRPVFRRVYDDRADVLFELDGPIGPGEDVRVGDRWVPVRDLGELEIRTGGHRREGLIAALGPAFRSGVPIEDASVFDVLPTLMALIGQPVSDELPGRVLTEAFAEEHFGKRPLRRVPRYDWTPPHLDVVDEPDPEILQRLESLGYVDRS